MAHPLYYSESLGPRSCIVVLKAKMAKTLTIFGAIMKVFQIFKPLFILLSAGTLLHCGGGNENNAAMAPTSLSIASNGYCTDTLHGDMSNFLDSCTSFTGKRNKERFDILMKSCERFTRHHRKDVVCNLSNLPDIEDPTIRECLSLEAEETAPNGILIFRANRLHNYCTKINTYADQYNQDHESGDIDGDRRDAERKRHSERHAESF